MTDKSESISYKTSLLYSKSLDLIDNGDNHKAIENLEKILKENPGFSPAKNALSKIKVEI